MRLVAVVALLGTLYISADATLVRSCGRKDAPKENANISVVPCPKLPCKFKRSISVMVEFRFKPVKDIDKVVTSVHAEILGLPFPFIGVNGKSACGNIFDLKGAPTACPLEAGQEYVYKDSFKILDVYPTIKFWVHWALTDQNKNNILCFEVPVKITS